MRVLLTLPTILASLLAAAAAGPMEDFTTDAAAKHGEFGAKAAAFLVAHMPARDKETLSAAFLNSHLDAALAAREEFPWARSVPEALFFNDVLPYAVLDETRVDWRTQFLELARPIVREAKSATEAAQSLNRELFRRINVHYHTGRKAPNQSARESMASGRATCTGLSIILVNACRAVGIPARAVGTPMWVNGRGNHTWVEIWDGEWKFTGADEYDAAGMNRGWFINDAAQARAGDPRHGIFATSWKRDGLAYPLPWAPGDRSVAAVEVTARYTAAAPGAAVGTGMGIRLFARPGGDRLVAKVRVVDIANRRVFQTTTKAGTTDLNDLPRVPVGPRARGSIWFTVGGESRRAGFGPIDGPHATVDADWESLTPASPALTAVLAWLDAWTPGAGKRPPPPAAFTLPLGKAEAEQAVLLLGNARLAELAESRKPETDAKTVTLDGNSMRWLEKSFGQAAEGERSLWISLHGGGNAPPAVNDGQWRNQIRLYQPAEGIYLAPRAPTDTWNLWHEAHIDPLLQRLIENHVALRGVDPDKVYLLGYSAGGDGVWQLAPRMADRFAAAAMMAGHPNEASLLGLRNLPFAIFMGGEDAAFDRNQVAAARTRELADLRKADPGGYRHLSRIYPGKGHWMDGEDAEALPWMAGFRRDPWPKRVVWIQDDITHDRFYWLAIPDKSAAKAGQTLTAVVQGNRIRLDGDVPPGLRLRLSDALVDLDQPVVVTVHGKEKFSGRVARQASVILRGLDERADLPAAATADLVVP